MTEWGLSWGRGNGELPRRSSRAQIAAYLAMEYGVGFTETYGQPLFDLPPEDGAEILEILRTQVPFRLDRARVMVSELQRWGGGEG